MRYLTLAVLLCGTALGCSTKTPPAKVSPGVSVEIHTVAPAQGPDTVAGTDPQTGMPIFLQNPPVITTAEVALASLAESGDRHLALRLELTTAGAAKISSATANPTGQQLALVVGGQLVALPKVFTPIQQTFEVSGIDEKFSPLVDMLLKKPPRANP